MAESISVSLPEDVQQELEKITREEGVPKGELIEKALKQHLFLRRLRLLRERMAAKAQSQGISTDQDVFDRIS